MKVYIEISSEVGNANYPRKHISDIQLYFLVKHKNLKITSKYFNPLFVLNLDNNILEKAGAVMVQLFQSVFTRSYINYRE